MCCYKTLARNTGEITGSPKFTIVLNDVLTLFEFTALCSDWTKFCSKSPFKVHDLRHKIVTSNDNSTKHVDQNIRKA